MRKPTTLQLRRGQRRIGLRLAKIINGAIDRFPHVPKWVAIDAIEYAAQRPRRHIARFLGDAGEEWDINAVGCGLICQVRQIIDPSLFRCRPRVIFVFELEENDAGLAGRLAGDLVLGNDRADGIQPMLAPGDVDRIVGSQPDLAAQGIGRSLRF